MNSGRDPGRHPVVATTTSPGARPAARPATRTGRPSSSRAPAVGSYYNQAINADAPNPAAARLWEEYIYTPAVQNLYLAAGAYPATLAAMEKNSTVDAASAEDGRRTAVELRAADRRPGDHRRGAAQVRLVEGRRLIR